MNRILTLILITICFTSFASTQEVHDKLKALEADSGGRIGLSATNIANNAQIQYRAEERVAFQSTMKAIVAANILKQSMTDKTLLDRKITYKQKDLIVWSPITEKHVADGMTVFDLCEAAIAYSDNTAANLLIKELGGPNVVTDFARSMGDRIFRLDNIEPDLNQNPKALKDTTTPLAMEKSLKTLAFGNALGETQREQLLIWMKSNTTGNNRIRAGVPKDWVVVADKTGSGDYGITNDIGIIWPKACNPIVLTVYYRHDQKDASRREDIVASATRILIEEFAKSDQCIQSIL